MYFKPEHPKHYQALVELLYWQLTSALITILLCRWFNVDASRFSSVLLVALISGGIVSLVYLLIRRRWEAQFAFLALPLPQWKVFLIPPAAIIFFAAEMSTARSDSLSFASAMINSVLFPLLITDTLLRRQY